MIKTNTSLLLLPPPPPPRRPHASWLYWRAAGVVLFVLAAFWTIVYLNNSVGRIQTHTHTVGRQEFVWHEVYAWSRRRLGVVKQQREESKQMTSSWELIFNSPLSIFVIDRHAMREERRDEMRWEAEEIFIFLSSFSCTRLSCQWSAAVVQTHPHDCMIIKWSARWQMTSVARIITARSSLNY